MVASAPHIDADGAVKFQGVAAGGRFGIAEHHADLHADLVDEDKRGFALADNAGEFSHRLAHQAGLKADVRIAHIAGHFGGGNKGGDRIDDDHIDGVGFDEHFGDIEGLFAGIGLADKERTDINADAFCPCGIEGVLGIDKGRDAA